MTRNICKCGKQLITPIGPSVSKILLVGDFPGPDEIIRGIPFVGKAGDILKQELILSNLSYHTCRITYLWNHMRDEANCDINIHLTEMSKEIRGKRFVLFMGSEITEILFGCGVMELSGLEVKHEMFPGVRLFISPSPSYALHGPMGEFRLAITRFAKEINNEF